ncbi:MAG: 6-hydroxycyclohex-1-ene-1-carbonyl-CoA dehydrogenase [Kofleriaceae bacterium]|nr:6-hydroxycyclohex-1-ene-1-carbonyl-CoA dehydrogenase [Kofleriaceae bacterium]MCB9573147.1 6-hydroxycyclohex-1-ene-1-carbonyl-CoA dehydrogenase [Kofleriaceae bacterium]
MSEVIRTGWRMTVPGTLEWFEEPLPPAPPGAVHVEVLGCGVCHTDLGYFYDGVPTAHPAPIVLGHEIVGRTPDGRTVLVPAVSPCGECRWCRRGRRTSCTASKMPGNHHDGGFASHVTVAEHWLCPVPDTVPGDQVWQLAAIADAVTTPLQAVRRTGLVAGDVAVVVGVGGVGGFLVQIAAALGAIPVAIDVDPARVAAATAHGAVLGVVATELDERKARKQLAAQLAGRAPGDGWHVFECSGHPAGQKLAFSLLPRGGKLAIVGFTAETVPLRLSNLMALDAEAYGNWGADPELYPEALDMVLRGQIDVAGAVERHPLRDAPEVLRRVHAHELTRRAVLVPHG